MHWMILPIRRYAEFAGRSRRKEFWLYVLFTTIVSILLSLADVAIGLGGSAGSFEARSAGNIAAGASLTGGWLANAFSLVVLVPTIAVSVRRLHDIDRSGWWIAAIYGSFIVGGVLIAVGGIGTTGGGLASMGVAFLLFAVGGIGSLVLLVWACLDGTRGTNRFGPDPKGALPDLEETFR